MFRLHTLPTTKKQRMSETHTLMNAHFNSNYQPAFSPHIFALLLTPIIPSSPFKTDSYLLIFKAMVKQLWLRHKAVWSVGGTDMYATVFTSKIKFLWSINLCPLPHEEIFLKLNLKWVWEHSLIWHKFFHDGWQKERPGGCLRTVDRCESANKHGSTHQPMQAAKTSQQQTEQGGKSQHW